MVLMITIVVVGLAFSVLNLVQKQMESMSENYEGNTELNLLRQSLWIDFQTYPNISFNSNTQVLSLSNEIENTNYHFEEEWVICKQDTFSLKLVSPLFYFDGKEVSNGPIDAIKLMVGQKNSSKAVFIYNENPASEYMY